MLSNCLAVTKREDIQNEAILKLTATTQEELLALSVAAH